jgi:hypothetical protein
MYPSMHVVPANWSDRIMNPATGRWVGCKNPLEFEASFQRSDNAPRCTEKFATEGEGHEWCKKMLVNNWTTPARRNDDGSRVATGRENFHEPFDYGTGHGVSRWSKQVWADVHQIQKDYVRETSEAWRAAGELSKGTLARLAELRWEMSATRVPYLGKMTSGRRAVADFRARARAELAKLEVESPPLGNLREVLQEAGARRDRRVARVIP